jgi:hypothetical protein
MWEDRKSKRYKIRQDFRKECLGHIKETKYQKPRRGVQIVLFLKNKVFKVIFINCIQKLKFIIIGNPIVLFQTNILTSYFEVTTEHIKEIKVLCVLQKRELILYYSKI